MAIEYRWAEGRYDRLPALAADLVGRKVDVILVTDLVTALAEKNATSTMAIVFLSGGDPVADGDVDREHPVTWLGHRETTSSQ